ncbi:hypothetical protein V5P93_000984 [Actinokineospora auranticolor]|uniref:Uncharacterized protein n=1 Tax=Actinokineospora auranticolor TaxID=155976 RepID=A0A2S6GY36_9PSEU|nr:hypothetical protein [Actinokineospora auranticolor]PPK70139.1 hypothetical protein CLV40_10249 [Actinokineospora auranticolor]
MDDLRYVRFQAAVGTPRGRFPGVFGLVNGLAREGRLTAEQEAFRRANNDWFEANFTNPSTVDPTVYDQDLHPGATAWFESSAAHLVERVTGYLSILDAHGVGWVRLESADPGRVIYEDTEQVVVVAHPHNHLQDHLDRPHAEALPPGGSPSSRLSPQVGGVEEVSESCG